MKSISHIIIAIFLALAFCPLKGEPGPMASPDKLFYKANIAYEAGEFDETIANLLEIIRIGYSSGNVFYNLANAYFKKGEMGKAILNYDRAIRFMPLDSDLISNRAFARSIMKQQDPVENRNILLQWLDIAFGFLTLKQSIYIGILLYYLLMAYILTTKILKRFAYFSNTVIIIFLILLSIVIIPTCHKIYAYEHEGIIITKITDARYEPLSSSSVNFPIYEGMKVYILRNEGKWVKIKRPDGKIGWIPSEAVEKIAL